jgi:hypothetical protein
MLEKLTRSYTIAEIAFHSGILSKIAFAAVQKPGMALFVAMTASEPAKKELEADPARRFRLCPAARFCFIPPQITQQRLLVLSILRHRHTICLN